MPYTIEDVIETILHNPHSVSNAVGELVAGGLYTGAGGCPHPDMGVGVSQELQRVARMRPVLPAGMPAYSFRDTGETEPARSFSTPQPALVPTAPRALGIISYDKIVGQS
jgi:hypothetical protein